MQKTLTIWGSCVSRDPFESEPLKGSKLSILSYLSKTTVVSQFTPVAEVPLELTGEDFATRMVRLDVKKMLAEVLCKENPDYILVDFIDERLPLVKRGNSFFTGSRFFHEKGIGEVLRGETVRVQAPENFDLWAEALTRFADVIHANGYPETRVILHKAWWARRYKKDGIVTNYTPEKLAEAHLNNVFLGKAYSVFRTLLPGSRVVEVGKELVTADASHKWGPDPFHYTPAYYEEFARQLISIVSEQDCGSDPASVRTSVGCSTPRANGPYKYELGGTPQSTANARLVKEQGFYSGGEDKRSPFVREYGLALPYLTHQREDITKFRDTGIVFDDAGIPRNTFRWGGPYYYSVTVGHYGLSCVSKYLAGSATTADLEKAVAVAEWLVRSQDQQGAWPVEYDHDWFPPRCGVIKAPWVSAMGQGLCISLLSRVASLASKGLIEKSKADHFAACAHRALAPFDLEVNEGGVRATLVDRFVFYEEYPTAPSSFVLNGFIYSLLGLHDKWLLDGDEMARELYVEGVLTLRGALRFYDLGMATSYDLTHITCPGHPPNIARQSYHFIHVQLLSAMNLLEGGFEDELERWYFYYRGWRTRTN